MPNVKSGLSSSSELKWLPEVPAHITSLTPYQPGKPIEETQREYGIKHVVKLASNENPLGPSPLALEAIRKRASELHLYPDGGHFQLKTALSQKLGCDFEEISIGNGSNELIDILLRVFVTPGRSLVTHQKAFVAYRLCAELSGAQCIEVAVDNDLRVNVEDIVKAVTPTTRMVMLANPNNPTGSYLNKEEIHCLASELNRKQVLLVLDYAYWEYVTQKAIPDPMEVYREHPNVMILRTFSKVYGLAGIRVGYLVGRRPLISAVERARQPFNVNELALVGAAAALKDREFLKKTFDLNNESKAELEAGLSSYPVRVYPSQGNFLLVDFKKPSAQLHPEFLKRGVILRPVANYGLPTCFRITAGLRAENRKFLAAMQEVFK